MKKILSVFFVTFAGLGVASPAAFAAANSPYHLTSVSWVVSTRDNARVDNTYVTLIGRVTEKVGEETYLFTDGTGTLRLDSENFKLPIGSKIVVGGRIDQAYFGFGELEVNVRHWHLVQTP
ncbi:MAG TPA: NirD/YgiW/YdeI family stress tolerance protein [Candidatus Methylacidiphilales bacterium]